MRRLWKALIVVGFLFAGLSWHAHACADSESPEAQVAGNDQHSLAPPTSHVSAASINTGRIQPRPAQVVRGWGMSLAWEANDLYGGDRQPAKINDPATQSAYMDLLYGNPDTGLTLGLNIARYNIGGGDDPTHTHMRPDAQMEGYQSGPNAIFDWNRDAPQRKMLQEAKKRGADIFEAAAYSPPYWMTVSGCASGSKQAHQDNLRPEMRQRFVDYLTTVVKHFRDAEGVAFESIEPFNEPDLSAWTAGGAQEGYSAPIATQDAMIPMLASRLKQLGSATFVAGVDTNNVTAALTTADQHTLEARASLGRLNTHDYHHDVSDLATLKAYKALSEKLHKPIWMSELGCCFRDQKEPDEMWGALFMSDSIRTDLRDLGAEAWILWQPDWEIVAFDPHGGKPKPKKQYYAIAQYTRFIRPGFRIISAGGAFRTLAAYSSTSKRLVLVTTNGDNPGRNELDLSAFAGLPHTVQVYRTTADVGVDLRAETIAIAPDHRIIDPLPPRSISTYVIDGATPLPGAPTNTLEGMHQLATQSTGRCINIVTNSTQSGAAIIPYACGAYINELFNFVDRGNGFYSIQTVNAHESLCLNIANDASSPGDGKTRGGPGNLIQWPCGETSVADNAMFYLEAAGADSYRIHVKGSGLCLEEPSGASTLRQNRCDSASSKQLFTLR